LGPLTTALPALSKTTLQATLRAGAGEQVKQQLITPSAALQ